MFDCKDLYYAFQNKFSFEDGNMTPPGLDEARALLVEGINRLAPADSTKEAYAWDRGGMHNSYFILWRGKGSAAEEDLPAPEWLDEVLEVLNDHDFLDNLLEFKVIVSPREQIEDLLAIMADDLSERVGES